MDRIYLSPPHQSGFEETYFKSVLASNWLAPVGPQIEAFEAEISKLSGGSVCALNSGTSALHLALVLAKVGLGDYVLVQTNTHNATVNPIIYQGAIPIFIDSDEETWN